MGKCGIQHLEVLIRYKNKDSETKEEEKVERCDLGVSIRILA